VGNYVSDQTLDRIRQATEIVALVRNTVPLKKAGSGFVGLCPFHKEKTPSFHVNPEKQIFKCFGCGVAGNIFSFVMKLDGITFPEAVRLLAERAHVELPEGDAGGARAGEKSRLCEVNAWAAETFHRWLTKDAVGRNALQYLVKRGLKTETIRDFQLGFSPPGWDSLLKAAARKGYEGALLLKAGLTAVSERSEGAYDRFRNRVMFPIRDAQDRVIAFGGRSLGDEEPKYLNSPETPLFSKGRVFYALDRARADLREKRQAIVVEGYMDAAMAHQFGVSRTVAVLGTALSLEHVRLLRRHADEAILLFDSDNAGQTSASRSVDAFAAEEVPVRVATLPEGLDPDEFLLKYGVEAFLKQLEGAPDGVTYKLGRALATSQQEAGSALPPMKALDDVLATVALMPNSIARGREIRRIAERTGVPEMRLQQRLQALSDSAQRWSGEEAPQENRAAPLQIEKRLLLTLLAYPETVPVLREGLKPETLTDPGVRALIERTLSLAASSGTVGPAELLARTQEEGLREIVEELIGQGAEATTTGDPGGDTRWLLGEIEARWHERLSTELHRKATTTAAPAGEDWNERLRATREAHRARGTLHRKRTL